MFVIGKLPLQSWSSLRQLLSTQNPFSQPDKQSCLGGEFSLTVRHAQGSPTGTLGPRHQQDMSFTGPWREGPALARKLLPLVKTKRKAESSAEWLSSILVLVTFQDVFSNYKTLPQTHAFPFFPSPLLWVNIWITSLSVNYILQNAKAVISKMCNQSINMKGYMYVYFHI